MRKSDKRCRLILASQSPRRKELLGWLGIPFDIIVSNIDECSTQTNPTSYCLEHARWKGEHVANEINNFPALIVSSDTIVVIDNKILNKPENHNEWENHLLTLSGREHEVFTAVYLHYVDGINNLVHSFSVNSMVKFNVIDPILLQDYLQSNEGMDKAGGYGIQGRALGFIDSIQGSYSNIVGFPLSHFHEELKHFLNSQLGVHIDEWRSFFY